MAHSSEKDIVRYTLQSYVGNLFTETEISTRQKEAVRRLTNLREEKFQELCNDVVNEIHRRSGVKYDTDNKMIQKFSMLSTEKFKNLVVDTLIVYHQKNPEARVEDMPEFLENLQRLIEALKVDSERESFVEKLKKLSFYNKLQEFVVYVNGLSVDKMIIDHINESLQNEIEKESSHLIECFGYPKVLLQKIEDSHSDFRNASGDFQASKKIIYDALECKHSSVVKEELIKVMKMVISSTTIPAKRIECFEKEIGSVIGSLESIRCDLEENSPVNLSAMSENLIDSIDRTIEKSTNGGLSEETVSSLHIHRVTLEGLTDSASRIEAFNTVLGIAKELRSAFKEVDSEVTQQ